jgi:hypothetical protein
MASDIRMEVEEDDSSASNNRNSDPAEVNVKNQTTGIKQEPFEFADGQDIKKELKVIILNVKSQFEKQNINNIQL